MKKTLLLLALVLTATNLSAQKFDPNTRYRLVARGVEGMVADQQMYYYYDDVGYSTLSYHTEAETISQNSSQWWYIRRTTNGWTLQNATTERYLEMRQYHYSYNWEGTSYSGVEHIVRTNDTLLGDSAVWTLDYVNDGFRFASAAMPEWCLGVYAWEGEYGSSKQVTSLMVSWNFDHYVSTFDVYAEDGTLVTGEGMPAQVLSSMHLNGKTPLRLNSRNDCLVTMAQKDADTDYDISVTWDGAETSEAYRLEVEEATTTEAGLRITDVSCHKRYPFIIYDNSGENILSGALCFTTLPIAELNAENINGSAYVQGTFRLQDPDYAGIDTTYTALTKVRGATAQRYAKKPYNVKLYEADATTEQDANLLGLRNTHTWILDAMYVDRIRMRNRVCFDTWNEIDSVPYNTNYNQRNGTVGRFVEVFVSGEYKGIYCLTDKVNRKLLNLTKVAFNLDSTVVTPRGLLYKGKQWGDDTYLKSVPSSTLSTTVTWGNWELEYPDDYPSTAAWTPLRNLINYGKMSEARFKQNFEENYYFDNLLNYALLQLAYNLEDNGMKNMYISTKNIEKAGKRMLFTVWDIDSSLGGLWDGQHNDITADTTYLTRVYPLARLFSKNLLGFRDSLRQKWHNLSQTILSPEHLAEKLDTYATLLTESGAWTREYNLWGTACNLTADINDEIAYVKAWYERNIAYLNELLPELPTGLARLQLTPNATQGIYTIDGRRIEGQSRHNLPHGIYIIDGRKVIL